jgi:hypothetical protein
MTNLQKECLRPIQVERAEHDFGQAQHQVMLKNLLLYSVLNSDVQEFQRVEKGVLE